MIAYIKGKVLDVSPTGVIIENNGIGYEVLCSSRALAALTAKSEGEIYTYMAVKEDGISLYGFVDKEERNMFLKLITVSGVGAKMAIGILSNVTLKDLAVAIATANVKVLSSVKGCGKKTAERIIIELKEKVSSLDVTERCVDELPIKSNSEDDDLIIGLMSLGFTKGECVRAVNYARNQGATTTDEIVGVAIKSLR